jgi:hypothetical protein
MTELELQEAYKRGVKIHEQMEEYLKTHSITYTEEETKLYESGLEYSQPDYIFDGQGMYYQDT